MRSILDLLSAIAANPHIEPHTRARATVMRARLQGRDVFASIFGGLS